MRNQSQGVFLALAIVMMAACLSPTLPLPPPDEPESIQIAAVDGMWDVRGNCSPGAVVLVENVATGEIFGTEDRDYDGEYFVRVAADTCDVGEIYELLDSNVSATTVFVFEPVTNGVAEGDSCAVE